MLPGTTTWQNTTITTTTAATAGMSITMTTRFRWQNAALSILKTTWFWILLSVAAAAALESYLPLEQITQVVADHSMLSGLLAAVIGFPLHSDVFSITPIIQLLRGMSAPVALTFTLSAMVTSVPSVVLLTQALKPKAIVRYVGILVLLTLCCSLAALVIL